MSPFAGVSKNNDIKTFLTCSVRTVVNAKECAGHCALDSVVDDDGNPNPFSTKCQTMDISSHTVFCEICREAVFPCAEDSLKKSLEVVTAGRFA